MPRPNSLNHWKITHWTASAKGGFRTVRFLFLQIFLNFWRQRWHRAVLKFLCIVICCFSWGKLRFNIIVLVMICLVDSKSYLFLASWPSKCSVNLEWGGCVGGLRSLLLGGVNYCSCWSWCPHSPYHYLHWPTHTILCNNYVHCSTRNENKVYLTKLWCAIY